MWRPTIPINFITLHCRSGGPVLVLLKLNFASDAWIIFCSLLGLVVLYPNGDMSAIDAFFFGASASTESGLNR